MVISSNVGINYGRLGDNLPSPYRAIELIKSMNATRVKLYDANPEILKLLSGTKIQVSIMVTNDLISAISVSQDIANQWVRENVLPYYPDTLIRFIFVGNEILSYTTDSDRQIWPLLVPAMRRIKNSLMEHNIKNIKLSTALAMDIMESTFPPSNGMFRSDMTKQVLVPLLRFLNGTRSFFFLDAYTYFPWSQNPKDISLDSALLRATNKTYTDPSNGLVYTNLLDQILDSVVFAMSKLGFDNVMIGLSETGWPHFGDIDQPGVNIFNAATYNRNLVRKMTADPPAGTPARPGVVIPTFLFSLFDENQKDGQTTERHWGLLYPNGRPIYELDLTGKRSARDYPKLLEPTNNQGYKGNVWCVAVSGVNSMDLGSALSSTCGVGYGLCDALAPGRDCYEPVSVRAHASYAFSSYWAKYRSTGATCHFNGLAVQTTTDPSKYPHFPFPLKKKD